MLFSFPLFLFVEAVGASRRGLLLRSASPPPTGCAPACSTRIFDLEPSSDSEFVAIAKVGDIPAGEGRCYPINGRMIAMFFTDGEYRAIDDFCPHMGASLSAGWVEEGAVTCPWHAWRFCTREGTWLDNPRSPLRVGTYEVKIEGDDIFVRVPPAETESTK